MYNHAVDNSRPALPIPDKLFYKIGEVSRITGIEPYVLRYWETEFPFLRPRKNKSGQRVYVRKEVELILQVKRMLYQERYTIEGVRKRLGGGSLTVQPEVKPVAERRPRTAARSAEETIGHIRKKLQHILSLTR